MNNTLAEITLDPKNRTVKDFSVAQKQFRFKCKKCATLCCKLGGPLLSEKDIELIRKSGHRNKKYFEQITMDTKLFVRLKKNEDGSCIFLQHDKIQNCFKCMIYDSRPVLCRLYPFSFERIGNNTIALNLIPCCRGLNNKEGKIVDKEFISTNLLEPLPEAMKVLQEGKLI